MKYKFRVYDSELGCIIYLEDMIERALKHKDRMLNGEVIVDCDAGNILMLMRSPESLIKWMQYTGLKDCQQTDIYDGDIVKNDYYHFGVIKWRNDRFIIDWINNEFGYRFDLDHWAINRNIVVIGNIYENPDLLKEDNHAV